MKQAYVLHAVHRAIWQKSEKQCIPTYLLLFVFGIWAGVG